MSVSGYTREVCRRLCMERYAEMEMARLDRKAAIMHKRPLTEAEATLDAEERKAALRMLDAANAR